MVHLLPLYPSDALHIGICKPQLAVAKRLTDKRLQLLYVQTDVFLQERDALPYALHTVLLQFLG